MAYPTVAQLDAAAESESRPGVDSYGIGVGSLVMPNGSVIAVWQGDAALASALIAAWWEVWNQ